MKEWIKNEDNYDLHFYTTDNYGDRNKDTLILTMFQNKSQTEVWHYTSDSFINIEHGFIKTEYFDSDEDNLQKAKEIFEKMVAEYCEDSLCFYKTMFKDFSIE